MSAFCRNIQVFCILSKDLTRHNYLKKGHRKNYSALVIDLQKDDCTLYLSAVEDPAEQMPHDALTDFLTAMGWQ